MMAKTIPTIHPITSRMTQSMTCAMIRFTRSA